MNIQCKANLRKRYFTLTFAIRPRAKQNRQMATPKRRWGFYLGTVCERPLA